MTGDKIGDRFQDETKYGVGRHTTGPDRSVRPDAFKTYPDCLARIPIPPFSLDEKASLWAALAQRRSRREFRRAALPLSQLARLLWAASGITARAGEFFLRTAPSAGALYPLETYLAVHRMDGLEPGLYHLDVRGWALELLRRGDLEAELTRAALNQSMCADAPVVFLWTAVMARSKWKYGERAYRYLYLDAGHVGENLYLAAEALGLGCCTIGAFLDDEADKLLGVESRFETTIYLAAVGAAED